MRGRGHAERGQTLPLWVLTTLLAMTLILFVFNYANTVRYAIRAQNAADSAAAAALGNDAAALNTTQTLLAAFDIQELRVRDVVGAVPQLLTGGDPDCSSAAALLTSACAGDLTRAAGDLSTQIGNLSKAATVLNSFSGQLTDRIANPSAAVKALLAPNGANGCTVAILTDCDFKYTTTVTYGANGLPTVDEYACKKIPNLGAGFLHLPVANQTFYAIGHTTATLSPLGIPYSAQSLGSGLQTTRTLFPSVSATNLVGNIANVNVASNYYVPAAAPPVAGQTPPLLATICP